jgi:hypothetical protein
MKYHVFKVFKTKNTALSFARSLSTTAISTATTGATAVATITLFLFFSSTVQAQGCMARSAQVSGRIEQIIFSNKEKTQCLAFLKINQFQTSYSCPLAEEMIHTYGLPVPCHTEKSSVISGRIFYQSQEETLSFNGHSILIHQPEHNWIQQWPF